MSQVKNKNSFYEVMWFQDHDGIVEDCFTIEFASITGAMQFYRQHKSDKEKYGWKVTLRRASNLEILCTYVEEKSRTF